MKLINNIAEHFHWTWPVTIGGVFSSFLLELLVYPVVYYIWKWNYEMKKGTVDVSKIPVPELHGH